MSSTLKNDISEEFQANSKQVEPRGASREKTALKEDIRRRAYEIYLERGEQPGRELDDWFQAEYERKRLAPG